MPGKGGNSKQAPVKGKLLLLKPKPGKPIDFLFNPQEISVKRNNSWQGIDGDNEKAKFLGGQGMTMDLDLFFDTTDTGKSVQQHTGRLVGLMDISTDWPGGPAFYKPPVVQLQWGKDMKGFPAVVTDVSVKFTYFSAAGVPLRAEASVGLMQYKEDAAFGPQNPTSGTPYPHRTHRTQPGETLDRIAAQHYGDATRWRALASANGIEDPLAVRPGSLIVVPEITSP